MERNAERRRAEALDRYWDAVLSGRQQDVPPDVDETPVTLIHQLQALDKTPGQEEARGRIWERLTHRSRGDLEDMSMATSRVLPSVTPAMGMNGRVDTLSGARRQLHDASARPRRMVTQFATAALVLLTLVASFVAFRGSHRGRNDDEFMPIAAVIDSSATPDPLTPTGVTAVTLVETTLPAEALPRGVTGCALDLSDIPPESESTWNVFQNVNLRYVLSGEITVRSDSAAQVLRAGSDGAWEAVSAGTAVTLAPGDGVLFLNMTTATFSNSGLIPVETLGWQLVVGGSGGPNPTPPQWRGKNVVLCPAGGVALPGTAGLLRLRQVELAPDATLPPLPTAIIQMSLASPSNAAGTPVSVFGAGTKSDGTISNRDQKMAPFYVVTLELHAADNGTPPSGSPGA
jgi:hypothetical protein